MGTGLSSRKQKTDTNERKKQKHEISARDRRMYYGAWFLPPHKWQERYKRQIETCGGTKITDKSKVGLKAKLPGSVDMMGTNQPVKQLQHSTLVKVNSRSCIYLIIASNQLQATTA